jgi:hypothetical protein
MAVGLTALLVAAGLVLDFGLVRLDRQTNKSGADAAASAGLKALDNGTGNTHPFKGACEALAYLKVNRPELAGLTGTWTRGTGTGVGDPCASGALNSVQCDPANLATWAVYQGTSTDPNVTVTIKSGYQLADGGFSEEALASLAADGSASGGCDQLAVIITQTRSPGLGSLATSADLVSSVRSVGRVELGNDGDVAVALVVLERTGCGALHVEGSNAKVHVLGNGASPGLIHVDSDGSDTTSCSTDYEVINVNSNTNLHAVVANAAVTAGPTGSVEPGQIGVYGLQAGTIGEEQAADEVPRVYAGPYPPGTGPVPRDRITRKPVHDDYAAGVKAAMAEANTAWATPAADVTVSGGNCSGSTPPTPNAAGVWYFDCDYVAYNDNTVLSNATKVIIRGQLEVKSGRYLALPNVTDMLVNRPANTTGQGVILKGQLRLHTRDTDGSSACTTLSAATTRARLLIGRGSLFSEGASPLFRACDTTLIMMGGSGTGCVPTDAAQEPQETTACTTGSINLAGNATTDWTAPDLVAQGRTAADLYDLEDLALWTESEAESSVAGGGGITLAGVFALPNARPFNIGGGGAQNVRDSQYFTRRLTVRGLGTLEMSPNPYNVTTVPYLGGFELVR